MCKDYRLTALTTLLMFVISSCAPITASPNIWSSSAYGTMSGEPRTDL